MKNRGFEIVSAYDKQEIILPTRATTRSAGYDLRACETVTIHPGEMVLVKTGLKAYMQKDEVLKIYIRSSLATKRNLVLANGVGIIDADYYNNPSNEGHILIALRNIGQVPQVIEKQERIAQGIFEKYLLCDGDDFKIEVRRLGGFGSS